MQLQSFRTARSMIAYGLAALVLVLTPAPARACTTMESFPERWRHDLESNLDGAREIYWARLTTDQWMPSTWMLSLCGGHHWGNGGSGPFYCAAGQLEFDVRETLRGDSRGTVRLTSRQTGYVEVRPLDAIHCCVATDDISPNLSGPIEPRAMGGCGPTVLVPDRSYLLVIHERYTIFVGPIERSTNPILVGARSLAAD